MIPRPRLGCRRGRDRGANAKGPRAVCGGCSSPVGITDRFCNNCGHRLAPVPVANAQQARTLGLPQGQFVGLVIVVGLVVLAAINGAGDDGSRDPGSDSQARLGAQPAATSAAKVTPKPTRTPEPTATPKPGTGDNPAAPGHAVVDDGHKITVSSPRFSAGNEYSKPPGGYVWLLVDVRIENVGDDDLGYTSGQFSARDIDRGVDFDDAYSPLLDDPLGTNELSPGEWVTGQVALEVQVTAQRVRVKYDTNPIFGGENLYWLVTR